MFLSLFCNVQMSEKHGSIIKMKGWIIQHGTSGKSSGK